MKSEEIEIMRFIKWFLGAIFTVTLLIIVLLSSFEIAVYSGSSFFEKEYTKYGVTEDVYMKMDDLLDVTDEMMKYLKGDRDDLSGIKTVIDGKPGYFFTDSTEIVHMADVRELFLAGFLLRKICIVLLILSMIILIISKVNWKYVLVHSVKIGVIIFAILTLLLSFIMSRNFDRAFVVFHKIFFNNDLWILDPDKSRLINILPEGFFVDTAIRIGVIAGILILAILVVAIILEHVIMKNKFNNSNVI